MQANTFQLGMTVDLWMPYIMLMLVLMTLTLMQGHSGSARQAKQISVACSLASKQAINMKLDTKVGRGFFLRDLNLDFANVSMACPIRFFGCAGGVLVADVVSGVRPARGCRREDGSVHHGTAGLRSLPHADHRRHAQHVHAGLFVSLLNV